MILLKNIIFAVLKSIPIFLTYIVVHSTVYIGLVDRIKRLSLAYITSHLYKRTVKQ